jgi:hypothetical protein
VYYVQYAHARIASIGRKAAEQGIERLPLDQVDLSVLTHAREIELLRTLSELPERLDLATRERAPHKITGWVRELARSFHGFYHDCYVIGDVPAELTQARLWLVEAARTAGVKRFVNFQTAQCYGQPDMVPIPVEPPLSNRSTRASLAWASSAALTPAMPAPTTSTSTSSDQPVTSRGSTTAGTSTLMTISWVRSESTLLPVAVIVIGG